MRLVPTFFDSHFVGFKTMKEITTLRSNAHRMAHEKQKNERADHMVYGYFTYNDEGNVTEARLYSGEAKTDKEFEDIAVLKKAHIYAIHKS